MIPNLRQIPVINPIQTGKNIYRLKTEQGYTAKDLQLACELACVQAVYFWLQGRKIPSIDNLVILAHLFGVSVDDILAVEVVDV